jgi:hypothetical protein
MLKSEIDAILKRLAIIKGLKVRRIGRAANLIWIGIEGEGGKEYCLHLQTFFRFCDREKVLITDSDKYHPTAAVSSEQSFDEETFDWDVQGINRFDEWAQAFNEKYFDDLVVEDVRMNTFGDLTILFNHDISLTAYLEVTSDEECWRFFVWHSEDPHLVVTGEHCGGIQ